MGDELAPFVAALGYHFIEQSHDQLRDRAEGAFGAAMEFDNKRFPPTIKSLPETILSEWNEVVEATSSPVLLARLHDLLWVARHSERPDLHARAASDSYLEIIQATSWHVMDQVDCLSRALELARAVGDSERMTAAESAIEQMIESSLSTSPDSDHVGPGVSLTLLRALRDLGRLKVEDLDDRLVRAYERFSGDPRIRESIADLREPLIDEESRTQMRREQVQEWRQVADQDDGLGRVIHLEHALEIARLHRLADQEKALLRELQGISEADLGLQEISAEVKIPTKQLEEFHDGFVDPDGRWEVSLMRFGNYGPPGGTEQDVNDQVADLMQQAPIQFHVTKVVFGPDSTAIFKAVDDATHHHLARAEQRSFSSRIWSLSAVPILDLIRERHGKPSEAAMANFFTTELISADLASRIARSFDLYWEGDFDEAGHMLAPRLERLIRDLARVAGIPIVKPPQDLRAGGVRTLGDLLRALKGGLRRRRVASPSSEPARRSTRLNLRNSIAHDLHPEIGQADVALLLHAACFLRLLGVGPHQADLESS